jgi:hypothetical protein
MASDQIARDANEVQVVPLTMRALDVLVFKTAWRPYAA